MCNLYPVAGYIESILLLCLGIELNTTTKKREYLKLVKLYNVQQHRNQFLLVIVFVEWQKKRERRRKRAEHVVEMTLFFLLLPFRLKNR